MLLQIFLLFSATFAAVLPSSPAPYGLTLEDFNITSFTPTSSSLLSEVLISAQTSAVDFVPVCGPEESAYTSLEDILHIRDSALRMGRTPCYLDRGANNVNYWRYGSTVLSATNMKGERVMSVCEDWAKGLDVAIEMCKRDDGTVAGFNAAWGNGDLIVGVVDCRYAGCP
jgi:hypothetical protein